MLRFITLGTNSADDKLMFYIIINIIIIPRKQESESHCMKCQNLFSGKNKKNISICRLLKILPIVLSAKYF